MESLYISPLEELFLKYLALCYWFYFWHICLCRQDKDANSKCALRCESPGRSYASQTVGSRVACVSVTRVWTPNSKCTLRCRTIGISCAFSQTSCVMHIFVPRARTPESEHPHWLRSSRSPWTLWWRPSVSASPSSYDASNPTSLRSLWWEYRWLCSFAVHLCLDYLDLLGSL